MESFVHLDVRSAYSFLWGACLPDALVRAAAGYGQQALALADDGLFGAVRFQRAAQDRGLQALIGGRIILDDGRPLLLYVRNQAGYRNLCRLLSLAWSQGLEPKSPVGPDDLNGASDGLIALAGGYTPGWMDRDGGLVPHLERLRTIFRRPDELYVALWHLGRPEDAARLETTRRAAGRLSLPLAAAQPAAFVEADEETLHHTLVDIQRRYHHRRVSPLPSNAGRLTSAEDVQARIPFPDALANTGRIAWLCRNFSLELGRVRPPRLYPSGQGLFRMEDFCRGELEKKPKSTAEHHRRLEQELEAIRGRGLADYFWLIRDLAVFARKNHIRHSVRGSAAGSLVVHLALGGVDPLEQGLLFERFLNDGRQDPPDVDVDFDSDRRDEVLHHLMDLFPGRTAMVAAVHTLKARSSVRLAARALGYPASSLTEITRGLPSLMRGDKLAEALALLPELADSRLHREPRLVHLASRLARLPFQASVHLGGVVVAPENLADFTPVGLSPKGFPVAQIDKDDVEALGLFKMDLLGLRMHTALNRALKVLESQGLHLDPDRLPLDDPATYAMLGRGESIGVFQIESPGQRQLLGRLQPKTFADLVAQISLFRPGPVEGNLVDPYIRRRNGEETVRYDHPFLAPILKETYGVILFQEQVLRIVHALAGLSYAEADQFRRTMTKDRKAGKMKELKNRFISGALAMGHPRSLAETVFDRILALAAYGFCKSHAASFAHPTFQSAYLKAHHPQAFFLGLLNAGRVGSYPTWVLLGEARRRGVPAYPPHVNQSGQGYQAEGKGIRLPLGVINGIGPETARRIIDLRGREGAFRTVGALASGADVPRRVLGWLALSGALSGLKEEADLIGSGQDGSGSPAAYEPGSAGDWVRREAGSMSVFCRVHPLSVWRNRLAAQGFLTRRDLDRQPSGVRVRVAGRTVIVHAPPTRSGIRVMFVTIEDETGLVDLAVFPGALETMAKDLMTLPYLALEGILQKAGPDGRSLSITAQRRIPFSFDVT
jgi:DNA-directed DNA polymerase III PolC